VQSVARLVMLVLIAIAMLGIVPISYRQFIGTAACPAIGNLPACYVVLAGYTALIAAVFARGRLRNALFLPAWLLVAAPALLGTGLELFGRETCPRGSGDIPTCFYSLTIVLGLLGAFLVDRSYTKKQES